MRLREPGMLLALLSLLAVVYLVYLDLDRTSPGPLTRTHGRDPALAGEDGCRLCHGALLGTMADACAACHAEIEAQLAQGSGLHGGLEAEEAAHCGACHGEHGAAHALVDDHAFVLAGFEGRAGFDHAGLGFQPAGRHAELACVDCHPRADVDLLEEGDTRFLGLDQSCASCHGDPHGGRIVRACADCHGQEHPFSELAAFVHDPSFELAGAHADLECATCHPADGPHGVEVLAGAGPVPPERGCAACHDAPHRSDFLDGVAELADRTSDQTCAECHDARHHAFAGEEVSCPRDLHAASGFALDAPHAPHADLACAACHGSAAGEETAFLDRFPGRDPDACAACHEDPHGDQFRAGPFALQTAPSAGAADCLACHARHTFLPPAFDVATHGRTAFPLTGSHAAVVCAACHPDAPAGEPRRFTGTPSTCASCHADVHAGTFDQGCAACHGTRSFADVPTAAFSHADHGALAGFPLDGAHLLADCAACHPRTPAADEHGRSFGRVEEHFGRPVDACATCHADVHGGSFDTPGKPVVVDGRGGCARCHATEGFDRVPPSAFDHGAWTGFSLEGAHGQADCEVCHVPSEHPDAHGRSFGRIERVFGSPPGSCATCHADAHAGLFERPGLPTEIGGRESCARCHVSDTFRSTPEGFDHGRWTSYPLEGPHASLACASCHVPGQGAGARRLGRVAGGDCASCHGDPHVGQFARGGATDCARCHPTADRLAFDHQRDTHFPLDEKHVGLDCGACHVPWPLPGGGEAVRYKPLGLTCGDCHDFGERDR